MDVEKLKAELRAAEERLKAEAERIGALADDTPSEDVQKAEEDFAQAEAQVEEARARVKSAELRARAAEMARETSLISDVKVTKAESVYRRDRGGYFADLRNYTKDPEARDRLIANNREAEQRDLAGGSTTGGEFVPPVYILDSWVEASRGGRPFANAIKHLPLSDTGSSISLPALASGASTAPRVGNGAVSETDPVTASISNQVVEVAGQVDVARYAVERSEPGLEEVLFDDLYRSYAESIEAGIIAGNGNGTNGAHLGVLNVSGANSVTYTATSPSVAELFVKIADATSQAAAAGKRDPNIIVMHPRRWFWLIGSVSAEHRPFITSYGPSNAYGQPDVSAHEGYVGSLLNIPVLISHGVPTNQGTGDNQDAIFVGNKDEFLLYEAGNGIPNAVRFDDVGSGTGTVRVQVYGYSAFFGNRRPGAISKVTGTGLVTPTFALPTVEG